MIHKLFSYRIKLTHKSKYILKVRHILADAITGVIPVVQILVIHSILQLRFGPRSDLWRRQIILFAHEHGDWGLNCGKINLGRLLLAIALFVLLFTIVELLELLVSLGLKEVQHLLG